MTFYIVLWLVFTVIAACMPLIVRFAVWTLGCPAHIQEHHPNYELKDLLFAGLVFSLATCYDLTRIKENGYNLYIIIPVIISVITLMIVLAMLYNGHMNGSFVNFPVIKKIIFILIPFNLLFSFGTMVAFSKHERRMAEQLQHKA